MAWVRCCGGKPVPKDLVLLNNTTINWTTASDNGTPTTNYSFLVNNVKLQSSVGTYTNTKLYSQEIDFTGKNSLIIKGTAFQKTAASGSGTNYARIELLDSSNTVLEILFNQTATTQSGDKTTTINVTKDISTYTGNFKLQFLGFSWNPNYVNYNLTDCGLYV